MQVQKTNNNVNHKAHIILKESPQLISLVRESALAVGEKKLAKELDVFKNFEPNTPVRIAYKTIDFSFGKQDFLVATNLKNKAVFKDQVVENCKTSFFDFIGELTNWRWNRKVNEFWSAPAKSQTPETNIFDHDVFLKEDSFDMISYNKNQVKKEQEAEVLEERFFKKLITALHKDEELRSLIYEVVNSKTPKPLSQEAINRYMQSYRELVKSLSGSGWL